MIVGSELHQQIQAALTEGPKLIADLIIELCGTQEPAVREAVWQLIENSAIRINWDTELELCSGSEQQKDWKHRAAKAAEAFGVTIAVGVRAKGTWFVYSDDIEYDCPSPENGVETIIKALADRARKQHSDARKEVRLAEEALRAIEGLTE